MSVHQYVSQPVTFRTIKRSLYLTLVATCAALTSAPGLAHNSMPEQPGMAMSLNLAASWRSQNQLSDNDRQNESVWQIPGVMMGGHTSSYEQGTSLDEMSLRLEYLAAVQAANKTENKTENQSYAALKIGSHGGTDVSLENAYVGMMWRDLTIPLQTEMGLMTAMFSPNNHLHPSRSAFSLSLLGFDALLGSHVQDTGLRLLVGNADNGISAGLESYQGNAYPAAGNGGLHTLFLRHAGRSYYLDWQLQGWALQADADNRQDDRSGGSGHSHGNSASTAFDGYFGGKTDATGLFAALGWTFGYQQRVSLQGEYIAMQVEGRVEDANRTQSMTVDGDYHSLLLQPQLQLGRHQLAMRYETLSLSNTLRGAAVSTLAADAGLINEGHNPTRTSVSWNWQQDDHLKLRLEWFKDEAIPDRQPSVVSAGIVWTGQLL